MRIGAVLAVAALAGVGATGARAAALRADDARTRATAEALRAVERARAAEGARRDADLRFYQVRVAQDPYGANDRARVAALFMQRARETGDYQDYLNAEAAARASLAARGGHNAPALVTLAGALMAQHRFVEARAAAEALVKGDGTRPSYRSLLGELQMELGDYAGARATFGALEPVRANLGVAPRYARWLEMIGRTNDARTVLYAAAHDAAARGDLPREQVAWFHLRVGDLELRNGRLDAAQEAFRAGLAASPEDYRLLGEMARLAAARGEWTASLQLGERAVAQVLDPATLAVMSDAALASGDPAKAEEYARVMEVSVRRQTGALHRGWGIFLLDRGRRVNQVATQAAHDLETRPDVYGYDLLAWALHGQRKDAEAARAMSTALRLGTRDATLFYHAGMIERALGHDAAAKRYLSSALEVNPYFGPVQARKARAVLDSIPD
ncbi:Tetratricopeptide repeat-containing protein [bacterium JGI 053]|nr:Tetratricopeptide repeat-containing protein [bacterium JGI 053]